jgi:hypothetical protein
MAPAFLLVADDGPGKNASLFGNVVRRISRFAHAPKMYRKLPKATVFIAFYISSRSSYSVRAPSARAVNFARENMHYSPVEAACSIFWNDELWNDEGRRSRS